MAWYLAIIILVFIAFFAIYRSREVASILTLFLIPFLYALFRGYWLARADRQLVHIIPALIPIIPANLAALWIMSLYQTNDSWAMLGIIIYLMGATLIELAAIPLIAMLAFFITRLFVRQKKPTV